MKRISGKKVYSFDDTEWTGRYLRPFFFSGRKDRWIKRIKNLFGNDYAAVFGGDGTGMPGGIEKAGKIEEAHKGNIHISMKPYKGKISDAGYDSFICLYTKVPASVDVRFSAKIKLNAFPCDEAATGQEGFGLFIRDTMENDPVTGYPYSNMAAAGGSGKKTSLFGRYGITADSIENVRNFMVPADENGKKTPAAYPQTLCITLIRESGRIRACIAEKGEKMIGTAVPEGIFSSVDSKYMYVGFMVARGCDIEIERDSVRLEITEPETASETWEQYTGTEPECTAKEYTFGGQEKESDRKIREILQAIDGCTEGGSVYIEPGVYEAYDDIIIRKEIKSPEPGYEGGRGPVKSPDQGRRKLICKSTGRKAVFDFCGSSHSFIIEGDNWDIEGISVRHGTGIQISGSGNSLKNCSAYENSGTGILIKHSDINSPKEEWPRNNVIRDCESYKNADLSECNADGFACKVAAGEGNRFINCTAYLNSDDGFDLFSKNRKTGAVELKGCKSHLNGYIELPDGSLKETKGNGVGFKLGGSGMPAGHRAVKCEAFGNRGYGFSSNSNPEMFLKSCSSANNGKKNIYYTFTGHRTPVRKFIKDCSHADDPGFDPAALIEELKAGTRESGSQQQDQDSADNNGADSDRI